MFALQGLEAQIAKAGMADNPPANRRRRESSEQGFESRAVWKVSTVAKHSSVVILTRFVAS